MRKVLFAFSLAALCISCSPPPFDLLLSQAAATFDKMSQDNHRLITVDTFFSTDERDFTLYPALGLTGFDYSCGFVVSTGPFNINVRAIRLQSASHYAQYGQQGQALPNPDRYAPPVEAWPVKFAPPFSYLFGIAFDGKDPARNGYALYKGDPTTLSFSTMQTTSLSSQLIVTTGFDGSVIGASVYPIDSGYDRTHWLMRDAAGNFNEGEYVVDSSIGLSSPVFLRGTSLAYPLAFIPPGISRCQYFYDSDSSRAPNRSFVSWFDAAGSTWKSAAWWGTTGSGDWMILPITHRIDALLSTGELLSTEGGMGRVYSRDGTRLGNPFPLGSLRFIGEAYVAGTARAYFSLCLPYDEQLHFNVYWIRTNRLKTLGD
jgi:hypothetical protein